MDQVLCGTWWLKCLVYLDDVISFGRSSGDPHKTGPSRDWRKCWAEAEGKEMYFYANRSSFSGSHCGSDWAGV